MIIYFADRSLSIIAQASSNLPDGLRFRDDTMKQAVEFGQNSITFYLRYGTDERLGAEEASEPGNYILCHHDGKDLLYTIIDSENDTLAGEIYINAENAGLDIIGGILEPYAAPGAMALADYVGMWLAGTDYELGTDETSSAEKALSWDEAQTITERLISTAEHFGCEVAYRFEISDLTITHRYIDFIKASGNTNVVTLRRGQDFERILIKRTAANIATSLIVKGGTPDRSGLYRATDETYTWVKFSEYYNGKDGDGEASMSDDYAGMWYIGIAAGKSTEEESEDPDDYTWGLMRHEGSTLLLSPLVTGPKQWEQVNGSDRYAWVMFATSESGANMSDQPTDRTYVGYTINKTTGTKGTLPEQYTWIPIDSHEAHRHLFISPGTDAIQESGGLYTWLKFSDNADGSSMGNTRAGKHYIGMSAHRASSSESSNPEDYIWKKITLNTDNGGFTRAEVAYFGIRQGDGAYVWVKFAKDANGSSMQSYPSADRPYIGIAYDKTHPNATFIKSDYEWYPLGDDDSEAVTLEGVNYDDGDFYVTEEGRLNSRAALSKYSPNSADDNTGHIVGTFNSDATDQTLLLQEAIAELTKRREVETTYEIELLADHPEIQIGDTVWISDPEGSLYLSARAIDMTKSAQRGTCTITFGEFTRITPT